MADVRRKIKKFTHRPNPAIVKMIDDVLGDALREVEASDQSSQRKREMSKRAIYAAGVVLAQELHTMKKKGTPKHVLVGQVIKKLEKQASIAKELKAWKGGPFRYPLKIKARELRRERMTPAQYVSVVEDRIATLKRSHEYQTNLELAQKARRGFVERPSVRAIQKKERRVEPDVEQVERFYKSAYGSATETDRRPTPRFNRWITRLSNYRESAAPEHLDPEELEGLARGALKASAPWKAPGEDGIPVGVYKTFPSARRYLTRFVCGVLNGEQVCTEKDARGKIVLLHKAGDTSDPANYRPIALLNTDYKILTSTITTIVKRSLPPWAIPKEQMAREGVWGTVHGLLADKAVSLVARRNGRKHYSAWIDFAKAYDSISHWQLRRLIRALPVHDSVVNTMVSLTRRWSVRVSVGRTHTNPIYVRRGVYQGDSISPLLFVLVTAFMVEEVHTDREANAASRGRQSILVYMDDIKVHGPTRSSIRAIVGCIEGCAGEVGLKMNIRKCGVYCRCDEEEDENSNCGEEEEGAAFLPRVREGYKYLGIVQLELDTEINIQTVTTKTMEGIKGILESRITPAQKIHLINTTVVTAATYVLGNMFTHMKRVSVLRRCREIDKEIRKLLVKYKLKTYSTSNASVYLNKNLGGLGLKAIADEVTLQYVRKGAYLEKHPDMQETRERYAVLQRKGWKNPKTDAEAILEEFGVDKNRWEAVTDVGMYARSLVMEIGKMQQERWLVEWGRHMNYGRVVAQEKRRIAFPAFASLYMEDWRISMLHAAAEEQLQGLGAIPTERRRCRVGCDQQETAYHVAVACPTLEYNLRHDIIVSRIIRAIVEASAPPAVREKCRFAKATMVEDFRWGERSVSIRAGVPVKTNNIIHHNKPDVMVILTNPAEVYVLEVAVSHLQNIRTQERIKRARYSVNSTIEVNQDNVGTVTRDTNLVDELRHMYRCPVELGVLVIGAYGETIDTDERKRTSTILRRLGVPEWRWKSLLSNVCYSAAVSTLTIIGNRMKNQVINRLRPAQDL